MNLFEDLKSARAYADKIPEFLQKLNSAGADLGSASEIAKESGLSPEDADCILRIFWFFVNHLCSRADSDDDIIKELSDEYLDGATDYDSIKMVFMLIADEVTKNDVIATSIKRSINLDTPNFVDSSKIICDARPIFSINRKAISEMQFVSQLKIETKENGNSIFELDEDGLIDLYNQCALAFKKIELMKSAFKR